MYLNSSTPSIDDQEREFVSDHSSGEDDEEQVRRAVIADELLLYRSIPATESELVIH